MSDGHHLIPRDLLVPPGVAGLEKLEGGTKLTFRLSQIPQMLFDELSRHFGIGDEDYWENPDNSGNLVKHRDLDPAHPHTGFKARIAFRKLREAAYFELWDGDVLDSERRHGGMSYALLQISAGMQNGGIWLFGRGNLMAESGSVHFRMGDFSLQNPSLRLIALITFRASQMATNPNCVPGERYWQADRNPGGDFTDPD